MFEVNGVCVCVCVCAGCRKIVVQMQRIMEGEGRCMLCCNQWQAMCGAEVDARSRVDACV